MYDELIQRLRYAAQWADKGLVITPSVCLEAADAIEELGVVVRTQKAVLDKFPRWIPVSERLPDNGVIVLAYYNNFMTEAFYANNQWHELATYAIIPTTHWMPLPEPPMEEAEGGDNGGTE